MNSLTFFGLPMATRFSGSLTDVGRRLFERSFGRMADFLASSGVSPHILTLGGLLLTALATYLYMLIKYQGAFYAIYAGVALIVGSLLDGLDGAVARRQGRATKAGALIDSTTDRVSDTLIALGIALTGLVEPILVLVMLALAMLVSYIRARGEALGVAMAGVGLGERWVRIIIFIIATLLTPIWQQALALSVVAVSILAFITVVQRIAYALRCLSNS
ncbi:MAG: CDP-alcohol phosphatidyltransferase family protein [Aigarchaeota archaeon]|nr:CDP-alcohol phosphatidyltransferase family protein [Candidatus Pelearchaeum maunauluense]